MNELEKSTARKLRELYGITVEELGTFSPIIKRIIKIPPETAVGLKGWSMIDLLLYEGDKGKRRKVGVWIRTSSL